VTRIGVWFGLDANALYDLRIILNGVQNGNHLATVA
jgi:hypothetical protein